MLSEQYKNHTVHNVLAEVSDIIKSGSVAIVDLKAVEYHNVFLDSINYIKNLLERSVVSLISKSVLDSLESTLNRVKELLVLFNNEKNNIGYLEKVETLFWGIMTTVSELPQTIISSEAISGSVTSYQNVLNEVLSKFTKDVEEKSNKLEKIETKIALIDDRIKSQEDTLTNQKANIDNITAKFQGQFSESQESRSKQFNETTQKYSYEYEATRKAIETQFQDTVKILKEDITKIISELETESKSEIEKIEEYKQQAANLLNITSNIVVTGHYKNNAEEEKNVANTFRWISLGCMALVILVAIAPSFFHLKDFQDPDFWERILYRLPVSFVFLIPAFYCARESEKHRKNQFYHKQLEIQLASIDPYLESLVDPSEKDRIKANLTEHFFSTKKEEKEENLIIPKDVVEITKEFIKVFKKS